jgi:hypothetical protein
LLSSSVCSIFVTHFAEGCGFVFRMATPLSYPLDTSALVRLPSLLKRRLSRRFYFVRNRLGDCCLSTNSKVSPIELKSLTGARFHVAPDFPCWQASWLRTNTNMGILEKDVVAVEGDVGIAVTLIEARRTRNPCFAFDTTT